MWHYITLDVMGNFFAHSSAPTDAPIAPSIVPGTDLQTALNAIPNVDPNAGPNTSQRRIARVEMVLSIPEMFQEIRELVSYTDMNNLQETGVLLEFNRRIQFYV